MADVKQVMTTRERRRYPTTIGGWLTAMALILAALPTPARAEQGLPRKSRAITVRHVPVENDKALLGFRKALIDLAQGRRKTVRVYHFGDSNVAADMWTGYVRHTLQERYGDGGPGYLLPTPHGSYHTGPVRMKVGPAFVTRRHGFAKMFGPRDGLWGLMGVAMEGMGAGAWFSARTPNYPEGAALSLHLLGQNPGGRVAMVIDREQPDYVDTSHSAHGLIRQTWPLSPGAHSIKAQVMSPRPVRVLGMVIERNQPGVVYDTLGINGHRVTAINLWNTDLLEAQFRARPPDLVVLSYGGNEGLSKSLRLDEYEGKMRKAIVTIRRLAPRASVLLVGPVAMCPQRPKVTKVATIQRRVAPEYGAGFWDSRQVSGGPGSLCHWIARDRSLVSHDRLHLRKRGYEIIAHEFTRALLGLADDANQN